jgi:hypothetical protein
MIYKIKKKKISHSSSTILSSIVWLIKLGWMMHYNESGLWAAQLETNARD